MIDYIISSGLYRLFGYVFLALIVFGIILLISYFLRDKLIANLRYQRSFSEEGVYEGESLILTETIYNKNWLPLFFVNVEAYIYNQLIIDEYEPSPDKSMQYFLSRFHLMPFMQIKRRHKIVCSKRGVYELDTADIYYNKRMIYVNAPAKVYVYPKVIPFLSQSLTSRSLQGDAPTMRRLIHDPFSVSGIRDYTFGDPFNIINFKATAKSYHTGILSSSALKVNNRDFSSNRSLMVYLNFQLPTDETIPTPIYQEMMENGLSYASALIRESSYCGYRTGFAANCTTVSGALSVRFDIDGGETHLIGILRQMAEIHPSNGISVGAMLDHDIINSIRDTEIYFITVYLDDSIDQRLYRLGMNNSVTIIDLSPKDNYDN